MTIINETIESVIKITAVILSFAGAFCVLAVFSRSRARFRPRAAEDGREGNIYSFLLIDVNKTGENTDIFVGGINRDIKSGKIDYIHKILLFDGADIGAFFDEISGGSADPNAGDLERMCGIIAKEYENILYFKK